MGRIARKHRPAINGAVAYALLLLTGYAIFRDFLAQTVKGLVDDFAVTNPKEQHHLGDGEEPSVDNFIEHTAILRANGCGQILQRHAKGFSDSGVSTFQVAAIRGKGFENHLRLQGGGPVVGKGIGFQQMERLIALGNRIHRIFNHRMQLVIVVGGSGPVLHALGRGEGDRIAVVDALKIGAALLDVGIFRGKQQGGNGGVVHVHTAIGFFCRIRLPKGPGLSEAGGLFQGSLCLAGGKAGFNDRRGIGQQHDLLVRIAVDHLIRLKGDPGQLQAINSFLGHGLAADKAGEHIQGSGNFGFSQHDH